MSKVSLYVKNTASNKDILDLSELKPDSENDVSFTYEIEKPLREPIVSKSPMGADEINLLTQLAQYFTADALVRIAIEGVIGNTAFAFLTKLTSKTKKLVASNNKQKGNAWGAKVEIKKKLENDKEQTLHFFLDNISEAKVFDAMSKIQDRVESLTSYIDTEYLGQVKNIGFIYDELNNTWKILGMEKFDGSTEIEPEDTEKMTEI